MGVFDQVLEQVVLFLLLSMRMIGLFLTAPIFSNRLVPVQLRVAVSFAVALLVLPLFGPQDLPAELVGLVLLAARELLVGLVIGFLAELLFSAMQFAGGLLDQEMGFAMVNVLDPMHGTQIPLMGNLLYLLTLLIFLISNGHHLLIYAVVQSYTEIPLGAGVITAPLVGQLSRAMAGVFLVGAQVAAPVMAATFLTTVILGVLNRAVPQMNVFVVGIPAKIAVGLFVLTASLPVVIHGLEVLFDHLYRDLALILPYLH